MTEEIPDSIVWWRSNVLRGLAVTMVAQILSRFKVTAAFGPEAGPIVDTILDIVSFASVAFAAYSRVKHPLPNITATSKQAAAANAGSNTPPEIP